MRLRVLFCLAAAVLLAPATARAQTTTTTTLSSAPASPEVNQPVTISATYGGDANFDSSSAAALAIDVGPAQSSAIGALTLRASGITTTGAPLTGRLTASDAPLGWQFEYGTCSPLTKATPLRTIPAGRGAVAVSARVQQLQPATTYTFQIVAFTTGSGAPDTAFGQDVSFTTRPLGQVRLSFAQLHARGGSFPVRVGCTSSAPCLGRLTIVTARVAAVVPVTASRSARPGS